MTPLLPLHELVGAAAHGSLVQIFFPDLFGIGLGDDREFDQLGLEDRVGYFGGQPDRFGVDRLGLDDGAELAPLGAFEVGVGDALNRVDHVLGRERGAVVEFDVGADLEVHHQVIQVSPGGGHLGYDLALGVPGQHVVVDVAVDVIAAGVPLLVGIQGGGLVHQIYHQGVFGRICAGRRYQASKDQA